MPNKKQTKVSKTDQHLIKKITPQQAKEMAINLFMKKYRPKEILEQLSEDVLPKFLDNSKKYPKKTRQAFVEKLLAANMVFALDSHYLAVMTTDKKLRPFVLEFCNQLVKEYNCKTHSEKALAELAVNAYARIIAYSQLMRMMRDPQNIGSLSHEKIGFCSMMSKELDRTNRQFITALITLKQFKMPPLQVNVRTESAFIAQNQQLNKIDVRKDENIKPK